MDRRANLLRADDVTRLDRRSNPRPRPARSGTRQGSSSVSYYLQTAIADDPSMWTRATDTFAFASGSKRQIVLKASSTTYSSGILERYIRLVVVPDVNETWWATVQAEVTGHDNPA